MSWTIEEIERDWGATSALPGIVVDAFERVERILGREWIAATRERAGGRVQGAGPLLQVISMGGRLSVLDTVEGAERLVRRLKQHDASGEAELTAMHLLHSHNRAAQIELEPEVVAGRSARKADFRIRVPGKVWTYVEVTRPNISEVRERITAILGRITDVVLEVKREFALEVFFRREPEDRELEPLLARLRSFCVDQRAKREEVDGVALLLRSDQPGRVTPHQEPEEPATPRLGDVKFIGGGDEPRRHIVARVVASPQRLRRGHRSSAAGFNRISTRG